MSREPLTREALLAGAVALVVQLLLLVGVSDEWAAWAGAALSLAVAAWIVLRVRPKVTPVADPRDGDGTPLVRRTPSD